MTKAKTQVVAIDRNSLIDATLTRMSEKSNKDSYIARKAQRVVTPTHLSESARHSLHCRTIAR